MWCNLTKESEVTCILASVPTLDKDGSNKADFFLPDVIGSRKFVRNFAGYPRSDIAIINEQTNQKVAEALLNDLVDYSSPNSVHSDTDFQLSLRSKYCQTPSEMIRYFDGELARRDSLRQALSSETPKVDTSDDVIDKV